MAASNFNIDDSITDYIKRVGSQGSLTPSDELELTAHLHDAVEDLTGRGLTPEEAFTIASKRLGNVHTLNEEYGKVNASIKLNRVWAYLLIGFNLFYAVPSLIHWALAGLYLSTYNYFGVSNSAALIVTLAHLVICFGIGYIVKRKVGISRFIEAQVQNNGIAIITLSFIPLGLLTVLNFTIKNIHLLRFKNYGSNYLAQTFNSSLVEYSNYLIYFSITAAVLALAFSLNKPERISIKTLFQKPSNAFLILSGLFIETLAASTRMIHTIALSSVVFGLVYLTASYIITFYNKQKPAGYLFKFALPGILMETLFGILADVNRGGTYFTVYFILAMLAGISIGMFIGLKTRTGTMAAD